MFASPIRDFFHKTLNSTFALLMQINPNIRIVNGFYAMKCNLYLKKRLKEDYRSQ